METEDPDLNAEFTNNERISYIKETISDLAREQEHLNAVLRLDPDWKGYDDGSERTAKIIDEHICVRTAGSYLPAASANNVFDACPAEYVQIVEPWRVLRGLIPRRCTRVSWSSSSCYSASKK